MSRNNIRIIVEYDGTNYHGWQYQKNGTSVQEKLEEAIFKVTGEKVALVGASRTDAGVHALGQVANFKTSSNIEPARFAGAINFYLPEDISVISSELAPDEFNAMRDAKGKTYKYYIYNSHIASPLLRGVSWHVRKELDIDRMRAASQLFEGLHDFRAFSTEPERYESPRRFVGYCCVDLEGRCVVVEIFADGFLYNMVRKIVGTLVMVGKGRMDAAKIKAALENGRGEVGPTAPARGLFLWRVYY